MMKPLSVWVMVKGVDFVPRLKTRISSAVPLPARAGSTVNALKRAVPTIAQTRMMYTIIFARGDCVSVDICFLLLPEDFVPLGRLARPTETLYGYE